MGSKSHHTSSMREALSACLLGLGMAILSLSVGANELKMSAESWRAACDDGTQRKTLAGKLLAASGAMMLMSMVLGVYHGARGVYSVLRAARYIPTCCSGSWDKLRHRLNKKPFLWQLALAFLFLLIFGCISADLLIRAAMNELQTLTAEACAEDGIRFVGRQWVPPLLPATDGVSRGIIAGGILGLFGSICSAGLFLLSDIKERRKLKARQYLSSSFYNEDWQLSDDEGEKMECQLPQKYVVEHTARSVKVKPKDKRIVQRPEHQQPPSAEAPGGTNRNSGSSSPEPPPPAHASSPNPASEAASASSLSSNAG